VTRAPAFSLRRTWRVIVGAVLAATVLAPVAAAAAAPPAAAPPNGAGAPGASPAPTGDAWAGGGTHPLSYSIAHIGTAGYRALAEANRGRGRILVGAGLGARVPLLAGTGPEIYLPRVGITIVDVADVAAALAAYRAMPGIAWAEADRPVAATAAPNDQLYPLQWQLGAMGGGSSVVLDWQPIYPRAVGAGVLVAVLDTGFESGGTDQPPHLRLDLARNFVAGGTDVSDDNGHGTFVANIIAENTDNTVGTAGVAPGASIVPIKVLGADGTGDLSIVAEGINYAASIGAQVINLSLAGDQSPALCAAVQAASHHAVVVAATGNDASAASLHALDFPAACAGALSVGSIAYDGSRPFYANTGCGLDIVAPGGDDLDRFDPSRLHSDWVVQQTYDDNPGDGAAYQTFQYFEEEGTSMSAGEVAGEAALLMGLGATPGQARRLIVGTARPTTGGVSETFGAGSVDIAGAVDDLLAGTNVAPPIRGYRVVTAAGGVQALNDPCQSAGDQGEITGSLTAPIVGAASTPTGLGYWLVASDGGIFAFGDAGFYGSTGALTLNRPIVAMAPTPDGHGYWLVASDGGIFAFGDAAFYGSTGALTLNRPIVAAASPPDGHGYWLVASDGGIFAFGDAGFYGSTAALNLSRPIVGMTTTSDGRGYVLAAADGQLFGFGDAPQLGSVTTPAAPVVAVVPEPWPGL